MKNKILEFPSKTGLVETSKDPIKKRTQDNSFSALDAAKLSSEFNKYLGKPQTVAQAYKEITNTDPNS